jgi:hypothetical protein
MKHDDVLTNLSCLAAVDPMRQHGAAGSPGRALAQAGVGSGPRRGQEGKGGVFTGRTTIAGAQGASPPRAMRGYTWSNAGQMLLKRFLNVGRITDQTLFESGLRLAHQASLLLAVVAARQAEAEKRHDVGMAVDAQDRHLPQQLWEALERGLPVPHVNAVAM